jgi:hypothetical protein
MNALRLARLARKYGLSGRLADIIAALAYGEGRE